MRPSHLALALAGLLLIAPPAPAEPVFPPGAAFGLEPPPGFAPSAAFAGFEARGGGPAAGGSILVAELPPEAFPQLRDGLTAAALAARGIRETARRDLPLPGGRAALLIEGRQAAAGATFAKWLLLVPDPARTGLLTATLPEPAAPEARAALERALATVAVRPPPDAAAQRAALPFAFEEASGLRFRLAFGGAAALLAPAEAPVGTPASAGFPSLVLSAGRGAMSVAPERREAQAVAALRRIAALGDLRVTGPAEPARLGGADGVLLRATAAGAEPGAPRLRVAFWLATLPDGTALQALATAPEDRFDAAWPDFRAVAGSLKAR